MPCGKPTGRQITRFIHQYMKKASSYDPRIHSKEILKEIKEMKKVEEKLTFKKKLNKKDREIFYNHLK